MAGPSGKPKSRPAPTAFDAAQGQKLRLDKWLFAARFFKSRELASALVAQGRVRLNGMPCAKPAHGVGVGDVLTFVQGGRVRLIRITAIAQRRGPAAVAQRLYVDLDAAPLSGPEQP